MKTLDTFFIRHQIPAGQDVNTVAKWAAMDLRQAARELGLTLQSEPQARPIKDGAFPQVEVWAHIPPRITTPKPPVFSSASEYASWRHGELAAA